VTRWFAVLSEIESGNHEVPATAAGAEAARHDRLHGFLAHELRNLLVSLGMMARFGAQSDKKHDFEWSRQIIEDDVRRLVHAIENLRESARLSEKRLDLFLERSDMAQIVAAASRAVRALIERNQQQLNVALPGAELWVEGDARRLERVLVNLLINASQHTPQGGCITLAAGAEADSVVLRVQDTGEGLTRETMAHIFDPVATTDPRLERFKDRLGIGLSIVRRLTELHGGTVAAASAGSGAGAEFTVRLPAARTSECDAPPCSDNQSRQTPDRARPLRVLVVDDDPDAVGGMVSFLKQIGYQVMIAHDGQSAIDVAKSFQPDAVLLDICLPDMDGHQVARRLRMT
jgi:two-component system CheB/CheR fusion protein